METTLQRIIRKLELNENAVSTILGGVVLIIVGFLFIGYFSPSSTTNNSTTEITNSDESVGEVSAQEQIGETSSMAVERYTVVEGDTLWSIAESQYQDGHQWNQIASLNNITNPGELAEGQLLDLPRQQDLVDSEENETEISTDEIRNPETTTTYEVQPGDHLWKIAQEQYDDPFMWNRIWQANKDKLTSPDLLENGMTLTIP